MMFPSLVFNLKMNRDGKEVYNLRRFSNIVQVSRLYFEIINLEEINSNESQEATYKDITTLIRREKTG